MMLVPFRLDPEGRSWPLAGKLAMSVLPGLPLFVLVLLIGYVYADAKRRGMRYVMWTLLAALIPNAIGDHPVLRAAGSAAGELHALRRAGPAGVSLLSEVRRRRWRIACPQCRRAVEPGWTHCGHCGAALEWVM